MQMAQPFSRCSENQEYGPEGIVMTCSLPHKKIASRGQALIDMSSGRLQWRKN
jgi:hypothetical protein